MTVRELREALECYDDNMEVVTAAENSMYVDGVQGATVDTLRPFWGSEERVVVLTSSGQVGAV